MATAMDRRSTEKMDVKSLQRSFDAAKISGNAASILKTGSKYARKLKRQKALDGALDALTDVLAALMREYGEVHEDTAGVMVSIADIFEQTGQFSRAVSYYNKALPIQEQLLGKDHKTCSKTALKLASIQSHQQEYYEKALDMYNQALAVRTIKAQTCCNNLSHFSMGNVLH
eukprot:m.25681 g.25681  ORF g.25681 m.25681 type:complete len:172 (-) comp8747_c0_seq3:824-1339(-)